jgi:mono/diheme cytochrome c family protein
MVRLPPVRGIVVLMLAACNTARVPPPDDMPLSALEEAGKAAVQMRGCASCHTGSAGTLAGTDMAPNLTPDSETGIGGWDDNQIIDALRYGSDNVGQTLCSLMPRVPNLADAEAKAIVAYLGSLKPVWYQAGAPAQCTVTTTDAALHGKLVATARGCSGCHGVDYSGGTMPIPQSAAWAPNLTPDMDTGVGGWTDDQLKGAITQGTDDQGAMLCTLMPRFDDLADDELNGLIAFLRALKPVSHQVPDSVCDDSSPVAKGLTYAQQRGCDTCHGPGLSGNNTGLLNGTVFPPNLTPDMNTGIGSWTADLIVRALRTGVDDQGATLCSVMPRYPSMSDEEANDIAAYLQSLAPVSNQVPDSMCPDDMNLPDAGMTVPDAGMTTGGCSMPDVVLSEVYGGGGNTGAVFVRDYVELHNRSMATVDVSGWQVGYASAAGATWNLAGIPPSTKVAPGAFLLLAVGPIGTNGSALPAGAVALSHTIDFSASSGKVALLQPGASLSGSCPTDVVDLIGYGTANCHEGGAAAPQLSATLMATRADSACSDTNANASDFTTAAPAPHGAPAMCACQ